MTLSSVKLTKKGKKQEVEKAIIDSMDEYKVELQVKTEKLQNFLKENKFDIKNSIDNIGVLPKEALKRKYFRTVQPLHSYLVYGKNK